jgi:hypothetical protein
VPFVGLIGATDLSEGEGNTAKAHPDERAAIERAVLREPSWRPISLCRCHRVDGERKVSPSEVPSSPTPERIVVAAEALLRRHGAGHSPRMRNRGTLPQRCRAFVPQEQDAHDQQPQRDHRRSKDRQDPRRCRGLADERLDQAPPIEATPATTTTQPSHLG